MINISKRLKSLVKYIESQDRIIDVGCDHALLDIFLIQNEIVDTIYVSDVNSNALQNGIDNINHYGLENKITPILSYGIEKISSLNVNTVIISGMGTKNIIEILSSQNINKIYKLILQSNNNYSELRRFLVDSGFNIFAEELIKDGKKEYINIIAVRDYQKAKYTDLEYEFGPILTQNPANLNYFLTLKSKYETIYYKSNDDKIRIKLGYLDEIISKLTRE